MEKLIIIAKYILAHVAAYHLGGWWAVILCFCMLELMLHLHDSPKDN